MHFIKRPFFLLLALVIGLAGGIYLYRREPRPVLPTLPLENHQSYKLPAEWLQEGNCDVIIRFLYLKYPQSTWVGNLYQKLLQWQQAQHKEFTVEESSNDRLAWQLLHAPETVCLYQKDPYSISLSTLGALNSPFTQEECDFIVTEYCKLKPNIHIAVISSQAAPLWPEIRQCLTQCSEVIYVKELALNRIGLENLLVHMYGYLCHDPHNWVHTQSKIAKHISSRFKEGSPTRLVFFETPSLAYTNLCKKYLRREIGTKTTGVHMTDTPEDAILLGQMLLNKNSIGWMNRCFASRWKRDLEWAYSQLAQARQNKQSLGAEATFFCLWPCF